MTKGFPPMMTCNKTSFSKASNPCDSIISYDMRTTYSKLGVSSTRAARSRSGDIGSNEAEGRCAGIVVEVIQSSAAKIDGGLIPQGALSW